MIMHIQIEFSWIIPGGKYLELLRKPECKSVTKKNSLEAWTAPCLKQYPEFFHAAVVVSLATAFNLQVEGWSFMNPTSKNLKWRKFFTTNSNMSYTTWLQKSFFAFFPIWKQCFQIWFVAIWSETDIINNMVSFLYSEMYLR